MNESESLNSIMKKLNEVFADDKNVMLRKSGDSLYFIEHVLECDKHFNISEQSRSTELTFTDVYSYYNNGKPYFLHKYADKKGVFTNLGHGLLFYYACSEPVLGVIVKSAKQVCDKTTFFIQRKWLNIYNENKDVNSENRLIPGWVIPYK